MSLVFVSMSTFYRTGSEIFSRNSRKTWETSKLLLKHFAEFSENLNWNYVTKFSFGLANDDIFQIQPTAFSWQVTESIIARN